MNISTFKDENYKDMDKIGIFSWIIHTKKVDTQCVYTRTNKDLKNYLN